MEEIHDQINHTTRTKPKFKNRLLILLGATIVVDSIIQVDKDVEVKFTSVRDSYTFKG